MTFDAVWGIIRDAGPLALAASFCLVWWLERDRANNERKINDERTTKFYELGTSQVDINRQVLTTLDRVIELLNRLDKIVDSISRERGK
jgi:hypothetical protein